MNYRLGVVKKTLQLELKDNSRMSVRIHENVRTTLSRLPHKRHFERTAYSKAVVYSVYTRDALTAGARERNGQVGQLPYQLWDW